MSKTFWVVLSSLAVAGIVVTIGGMASATRYTSPNYTIDASVGNSFGGDSTSTDYRLTSSGGESIVGNGEGGSYKLGQGYMAQLERSLQLAVQPSGLVAYYPADETEGDTIYDYSSQNNHGVATGVNRVSGKLNGGLDFPNAGGTVTVPDSPSLDIAGNLTISAWVKIDSYHSNYARHIISKWAGISDANYAFYLFGNYDGNNGGGRVGLYANRNGSWGNISGTYVLGLNQWYHVAVSYESSIGGQLYIDGQPVGVRAGSGFLATNNHALSMTSDDNLDEVKLYDRALSGAEIEAEYDAGIARNAAGLSFPNDIISGSSQTTEAEAIVRTDAPGYSIGVSQDNDLTSSTSTIPSISSGTIATPAAWNESTTKGLGFTMVSASATPIAAKWNNGQNYAALPNSMTTIYTRDGYTSGTKDVASIRYRLDVAGSQPSGKYTNTVTYTGVMTP
jgi:hypothetical protein